MVFRLTVKISERDNGSLTMCTFGQYNAAYTAGRKRWLFNKGVAFHICKCK